MAQPAMFVKQAKKRGPPSSRDGNANQEKWMDGLLWTNKVSMEKNLGTRERHNFLERARR